MQTRECSVARKKKVDEAAADELSGTHPTRIPADCFRMAHWICEMDGSGRTKIAQLLGEILRGPLTLRFEPIKGQAEEIEEVEAKKQVEIDRIKRKRL